MTESVRTLSTEIVLIASAIVAESLGFLPILNGPNASEAVTVSVLTSSGERKEVSVAVTVSAILPFVTSSAAASVADQEYNFELADRTNAAATHQLDLIRSILSALKTEMSSINFYKS